MGFFGKKNASDDEIQQASTEDVEKTIPAHQENKATQRPAAVTATLDPELERRVLRKLDYRVPTLMAFFCMFIS